MGVKTPMRQSHRGLIRSSTALGALTLLLAALIVLIALLPGGVEAHANYVESDPPANSTLQTAPQSVTIRFTEPLEPTLSSIQVLDSQGRRVDNDDSAVHDAHPTTMTVTLERLGDGAYTVAWKNVSTVDGHPARGSFAFSVGEPLPTADSMSAQPAEDDGLLRSGLDPILRWVMILGALTSFGALAYRLLVAKPAIDSVFPPDTEEDTVQGGLRKLLFLTNMVVCGTGMIVAVAASVALLILQASIVYESSILSTLTGPVWDLQNGYLLGKNGGCAAGADGGVLLGHVSDSG